jgi:programmed cell death 6-interacting protein
MATNILSVPFKRTKPVPLGEGLKDFISTTLDQHPEQFKEDLLTIDKLRADIIPLDVHPSTLDRLVRYHSQLLALSAKLPIDVYLQFSVNNRWVSSLHGIQV